MLCRARKRFLSLTNIDQAAHTTPSAVIGGSGPVSDSPKGIDILPHVFIYIYCFQKGRGERNINERIIDGCLLHAL